MTKDPAFPMYASDWLGSNIRAMMSLEQQGAYMNLLCRQWADPTCSLPDDDEVLARLSELGEGWLKGGSKMLRKCFPEHPTQVDRIANPRMLEIRQERDEWKEKSSLGGKKSAEVRRVKAAQKKTSDDSKGGSLLVGTKHPTKRQPNGNTPSPSPSPSSKTKNPLKSPKGDVLDSVYPKSFLEWWECYPRQVGKRKAAAAHKAAILRISRELDCALKSARKQLIAVTTKFAASDKGRGDPQYIPHPTTWLNEGRYDDDPEAWRTHKDGNQTNPGQPVRSSGRVRERDWTANSESRSPEAGDDEGT